MRTTTKLVAINSLVTLLVVLSFAWFSLDRYYAGILREEHKDLERCIQTFWKLLEHKGQSFRIQDGRLMVGGHVLNGNYEMPDKIQKIFGGVATIFMGDVRVATNVLNERGERAIGTRLVGPAREAIFEKGIPYRGEAPILGQLYLTAYDPIRDRNGDIIGALFVGVKKSSINRDFNQLKTPMIAMLITLLSSFAFVSWLLLHTTRQYELAEATNLNFLKTLMNTIPTPIFYKDDTGRYLGCNAAYESYLGVRREEIIGRTAADLWPSELAEQYRRQDQALFDRPGTQQYEGSVVWNDGTRHDVIFHKATFHSLDGAVAGLVGLVFDITERKAAEDEVRNANQRLHDIIEFLPDATFVIDEQKRVIAWNRAIEAMTGVRKEEIIGKGDYAYAVPFYGERRRILIDLIDQDQDSIDHQYPYIKRDGRTIFSEIQTPALGRHMWGTATPLFDRDGNRVGAIESIRDITDQKRAEDERARYQAEQHHSRMMAKFMIQLGHDLRTPLTPLFVLLPLIRARSEDPEVARMVDICTRSTEAIQGLTQKALKLVKLSTSTFIRSEPVDLAEAVDESISDLKPVLETNGITCRNNIAPGTLVASDPELLAELFGNLLSNAIRYTPDSGEICIEAVASGRWLTVAVRDNGDGMEPELVGRIFDEFYKGDESRHDLGSSGLGLSICKRIIDNHHGSIWAESPGKGLGMTVSFTLPLHLPPDQIL